MNRNLLDQLYQALNAAKGAIKAWHGMGSGDEKIEEEMWDIYDSGSPEMQKINAAIAALEDEYQRLQVSQNLGG